MNKKPWNSAVVATAAASKSDEFGLLGNKPVDRWDDDENTEITEQALQNRVKIAKEAQRVESERKRKMHLDRHDALLDQGKVSDRKGETVLRPRNLLMLSLIVSFIADKENQS